MALRPPATRLVNSEGSSISRSSAFGSKRRSRVRSAACTPSSSAEFVTLEVAERGADRLLRLEVARPAVADQGEHRLMIIGGQLQGIVAGRADQGALDTRLALDQRPSREQLHQPRRERAERLAERSQLRLRILARHVLRGHPGAGQEGIELPPVGSRPRRRGRWHIRVRGSGFRAGDRAAPVPVREEADRGCRATSPVDGGGTASAGGQGGSGGRCRSNAANSGER